MKRMLYGFAVAGVFLMSSGAFGAPKKALLVAMGGYNSCGNSSDSYTPPIGIGTHLGMKKVSKTNKNRGSIEWLWLSSCLDDDAPPYAEATYVLSSSPEELLYGDTYKLKEEIEKIAKDNPGIPVFIAGHSYGGWMSMYLTEELSKTVDIQALFTMDPISPDCDAMGVVFGSEDCSSAPSDRDNKGIRKRVKKWINFYQTEDSWITSSEIEEANENHHIEQTWGPHGDLDANGTVWTRVKEVVEDLLGL